MTNKIAPLPWAVSIDINEKSITGALVDSTGAVANVHSITTPTNEGADAILQSMLLLCQQQIEEAGELLITGVGISTIGLVHHTNGTILHADSSLPDLQDIAIGDRVESTLGLKTRVENNVNAMAIAESKLGGGRSRTSFFYIYADETLNGAFVQNDHLWHGTHFSAGQIGNLLVGWMGERPVELSQRASGAGIAAEYNMRSRKFRIPTLTDIIQYAEHGDQLAIRVIRDGARVLASVISPVINFIDPECVVVGGALVGIGDLWWNTFQETLRSSPLPVLSQVDIITADLTENAALIGAAQLVHEENL